MLYSEADSVGADMRNELVRAKIETGDPDQKLEALEWIQKMVDTGNFDNEDEDLMSMLKTLSLEPFLNPTKHGGPAEYLINDHVLVRKESASILGRIGGEAAVDILLEVLKHETNRDVLINAVYSLGAIGSNAGKVTGTINDAVLRWNLVGSLNNPLAFAVLCTLGDIADRAGGINDPELYQSLIILSSNRFSRVVLDKADEVIEKLWTM